MHERFVDDESLERVDMGKIEKGVKNKKYSNFEEEERRNLESFENSEVPYSNEEVKWKDLSIIDLSSAEGNSQEEEKDSENEEKDEREEKDSASKLGGFFSGRIQDPIMLMKRVRDKVETLVSTSIRRLENMFEEIFLKKLFCCILSGNHFLVTSNKVKEDSQSVKEVFSFKSSSFSLFLSSFLK